MPERAQFLAAGAPKVAPRVAPPKTAVPSPAPTKIAPLPPPGRRLEQLGRGGEPLMRGGMMPGGCPRCQQAALTETLPPTPAPAPSLKPAPAGRRLEQFNPFQFVFGPGGNVWSPDGGGPPFGPYFPGPTAPPPATAVRPLVQAPAPGPRPMAGAPAPAAKPKPTAAAPAPAPKAGFQPA